MHYPEWALERALAHLNRSRTTEQLLSERAMTEDPKRGGYVIGEKVAANILEHKKSLPRRRFEKTDDVLAVAGLGVDKLNDIISGFATPADEAFMMRLRDGILLSNWDLNPVSKQFASATELKGATEGLDRFRLQIAKLLEDEGSYAAHNIRALRSAHVFTYPDDHLAAFQFAFWWYLFDHDNWFAYDTIREACEQYLNHHPWGSEGMELRMLRLYNDSSNNDLRRSELIPVVINYPELCVTVWDAFLND
ncbi:hypothetical protein CEQ90_16765 [Lewinellaceae bacterium SD302]|nr:hypothetical protein CEQ90_16765 [Lewinellaceae bacterium SD302]